MTNSKITEVIYKTARDLYNSGLMTDEEMREFDEMCMPDLQLITSEFKDNKEDKPVD